jgi:hypothetical protein
MSESGQKAKYSARADVFRFAPPERTWKPIRIGHRRFPLPT